MYTIDSSEFPKKGSESVGVIRQYCGTRGKVDNCQSGVFLGYVGEKAHGFVDARLYMPQEWFGPEFEKRREKTGVPVDLRRRILWIGPVFCQFMIHVVVELTNFPKLDQFG